jgi:DNA end-binding protein Ku
MSIRSTWKGFLKIGFVTVPVKVYPTAETAEKIEFNQIHRDCGNCINQKKVCTICNKTDLQPGDLLKGYQVEKGKYVTFEPSELDNLHVASTKTIELRQIAEEGFVDPVAVQKAYYLGPDGLPANSPFAVMREGLRGKVGLGKFAVSGREYTAAVQVRGEGLVMFTLAAPKEVRSIKDIGLNLPTPDPAEVEMAKTLFERFGLEPDLEELAADAYKDGVRKLVEARVKGQVLQVAPDVEPKPTTGSLMDALRQSLDAIQPVAKKVEAVKVEEPVAAPKKGRGRKSA